jgi:hypothetical protein
MCSASRPRRLDREQNRGPSLSDSEQRCFTESDENTASTDDQPATGWLTAWVDSALARASRPIRIAVIVGPVFSALRTGSSRAGTQAAAPRTGIIAWEPCRAAERRDVDA